MAVQDKTTLKSYFNGSPVPSVPKISQYEDLIDSMMLVGAENISSTNLNDATETGFYVGDNLTNAPSANGYYILVIKHNANYISQEAVNWYSAGAPKRYLRRNVNGTWDSWVTIYPADWNDITSLPSTFTPSTHTHTDAIENAYDAKFEGDEAGVMKRLANGYLSSIQEHFNVSSRPSGWSMYGSHSDSYSSNSYLNLTGATGASYFYKSIVSSADYYAAIGMTTNFTGSTWGIRLEDGSDITYFAQLTLELESSDTWRIKVSYRSGSGDTVHNVNGIVFYGFNMPIHLRMNISGTRWSSWGINGMVKSMNFPGHMYTPNAAVTGLTWTPTRMGLRVGNSGGATWEDFYCDYFTWA